MSDDAGGRAEEIGDSHIPHGSTAVMAAILCCGELRRMDLLTDSDGGLL